MKNLAKDLFKRLVSSFFLISIVTLLIVFAYTPYLSLVVVGIIALFAVVATQELINISKSKVSSSNLALLIFSPLIVISFFLKTVDPIFIKAPLIVFFVFAIVVFVKHFSKIKGSIVDNSVAIFSLIYISVPLGMLVSILYSINSATLVDGRIWIFIILVLSKISDIFGYFIGKLFGKNKMIAKVSPNKTWEGSIAGVIATLGIAVLIQYLAPNIFGGYLKAVLVGSVTVILSQIGDLCESLLKRDADVKDSSKIPGIGGVLDSLDSILFTIPFYYIWLS